MPAHAQHEQRFNLLFKILMHKVSIYYGAVRPENRANTGITPRQLLFGATVAEVRRSSMLLCIPDRCGTICNARQRLGPNT
jgi:hypothetical protein